MTIDINELRRLAQEATPGPWIAFYEYDNGPLRVGAGTNCTVASVYLPPAGDALANAFLIAAANPAAISELLDRLEAAEKERDALRAKMAEVEKQEARTATWKARKELSK